MEDFLSPSLSVSLPAFQVDKKINKLSFFLIWVQKYGTMFDSVTFDCNNILPNVCDFSSLKVQH